MEINRLVWAKLYRCSFWPAKIVEPPTGLKGKKGTICVKFYGTDNYGFVEPPNVIDYEENRAIHVGKKLGQKFVQAIEQVDGLIHDADKRAADQVAKSVTDFISVKRERSSSMGTENETDDIPYEIERVPCGTGGEIAILKEEKLKIINDLVAIKDENQKLHLQLRRQDDRFRNMEKSKSTQIQSLQKELEALKQKFASKIASNDSTISELKKKNSLLTAQVKQFEVGTNQTDDDETFAVNSILKHRLVKGKREFLIRWENYAPEFDKWVKQKDLSCPALLRKYLKDKRLS